jgi:hypothetical protein
VHSQWFAEPWSEVRAWRRHNRQTVRRAGERPRPAAFSCARLIRHRCPPARVMHASSRQSCPGDARRAGGGAVAVGPTPREVVCQSTE